MAECPKCGHVYKDPARVKGGKNSKRKDMGKGSEGQNKAQAGKKKAEHLEGEER